MSNLHRISELDESTINDSLEGIFLEIISDFY